jgi:hypothetical protein
VLTSASFNPASDNRAGAQAVAATVSGTFNSIPNQTFTLEFFFGGECPSSGSQSFGAIPLRVGSLQVTTDPGGNSAFSFSFSLPDGTNGGWVNATATSSDGNTSEFSECISLGRVTAAGPTITNVTRNGKKLFVTGAGFAEGAQMFLNDGRQKKVTVNSSTEVVSKKAGNKVITGSNRIKIVNQDGGASNEFVFNYQP